jgi:hypothetical protein
VLFAKVVLALMLGRSADLERRGSVVDTLLADHGLFHLEADLRWIDLTAARLDGLAAAVRSA